MADMLLPGRASETDAGHLAQVALSARADDASNLLIRPEDGTPGAVLFERHEPGVYEMRAELPPEVQGASARAFLASAAGLAFVTTDAMEILTLCPAEEPTTSSRTFMALGGAFEGEQPTGRRFALRYPEWVRTADLPLQLGAWARERYGAELVRPGLLGELGTADPDLDRHLGAFVAMLFAGQPGKAVVLFNRWARIARRPTATLASLDPLLIDFGAHMLRVTPELSHLEVLPCPSVQ